MKRNIILMLCLLAVTFTNAQEKQFNEALQAGRSTKSFYRMTNRKAKMIRVNKVEELARQKDYILGPHSTKEIGRFGDVATTIKTWDFIPRSEYTLYLGENLNSGTRAADYKQKGTVFLTDISQSQLKVNQYDNVAWTGQLKNNRIDGKGCGIYKEDDKRFWAFEGNFSEGIPQGELKVILYTPQDKEQRYNEKFSHNYQSTCGQKSEGMTTVKFKDRYGFINSDGVLVAQPKYREVKDFKDGVAYVTEDKVELKIDKTGTVVALSENAKLTFDDMLKMRKDFPQLATPVEKYASTWAENSSRSQDELADVAKEFPNLKTKIDGLKRQLYEKDCAKLENAYTKAVEAGANSMRDLSGADVTNNFISVYTKHSYDPNGKMPMAKKLKNYQEVCNALNLNLHSQYWTDGYRPSFSSDASSHENMISNAISICRDTVQSDFGTFYFQSMSPLQDKLSRLKDQVAYDRKAYDRSYARYQAEEARKEAERRAEEARKEAKRRQVREVLDNMSGSRIYAYIVEEGKWSEGRFLDSDDDFTDHKTIEFRDIESDYENATFSVSISHTFQAKSNTNYYTVSTGFLSSENYTNEQDAIIGAFMHHYGRSWRHGRK